MILRARTILPVSAPPIENGALATNAGRITDAGSWPDIERRHTGPVVDLGETILMPGLINCHCHLDYTAMAGLLPPLRSFSDWIKSIVALKASWTVRDFEASWQAGAKMLVQNGTTTVLDSEAVPELLPAAAGQTPLRVLSCMELISVRPGRSAAELLADATARVAGWTAERRGLSPHAPYTTSIDLLRGAARETAERGWLLSTHVAESAEEFEMFAQARGAMYDWLKSQRDCSDCGARTPVEHLDTAGALSAGLLAVHVNYATAGDITLLARRGVHVVHCPRSHDYFRHQRFSYGAMHEAGINICLGTDSMASVHKRAVEAQQLSQFAEMRVFADEFSAVAPEEILRLVTVNAARAVGLRSEIGELTPNARADLIAIPSTTRDPFEAVLQHRGAVMASMIGGHWCIPPPQ